ncbi:MAG: arginine--tRNA ligase [Candidatus Bathyarchaeota archaeon]|nr:arginine--tRNA ligase [Candidatus Bathyarchaeota archaeon]
MVNVTSTSVNPFGTFRSQCRTLLLHAMRKAFLDLRIPHISLDLPPTPQFGELSSSVCFEISKQLRTSPLEIAKQIQRESESETPCFSLIASVKAEGQGYVNFHANLAELSRLTLEATQTFETEYGLVKTGKPERVIVEHTSANPNSPIHIGHGRNSVLGDSLARILNARGHKITRHYYIDDVGRQSALIAYGYKLLGKPEPEGKPDHFIGAVYAATNCLVEIRRLKETLKQTRLDPESEEKARELQRDLDDLVAAAASLKEKYPRLFNRLLEEVSEAENPQLEVNLLLREYEAGKEETKQMIREFSQMCLEGFKQTFARAGISVDSWDWESAFVWNGDVSRYLKALKKTPFVFQKGGVLEFDAETVAQTFGLKKVFGVKAAHEIPSLTLARADGTTLYTTRDIPYTFWKFEKADKVINVIGMEQKLSQLQLKLALCALNHLKEAKNLVHFAYNLVRFPGHRISGRRGRYVTFDEVMDESVARAYDEVSKRSPELDEEKKREISETVGVGAVKYALVETDPQKPVVFTWDKVLNFETNSGPYIQYSHARACSIMRKADRETVHADFALLKEPLERELVLMVARFPEIFIDAADNLKPNTIADYVNALADKFNTFYAALPVIKAEPPELSNARLMLVNAVKTTLHNTLNLIGIEAPQRM